MKKDKKPLPKIFWIILELLTSVPLAVGAGLGAIVGLRYLWQLPLFHGLAKNRALAGSLLELIGLGIVVSLIIIFLNLWKHGLKRAGIDLDRRSQHR